VAEPIRRSLQRAVNHLVYGGWEDPHELTRRLGRRLADAAAPDSALDTVLDELCAALRLRSATIAPADLPAHAHDPKQTFTPLTHEGQTIGVLHTVADRKLRPRDLSVLSQVAQQLAPVVRAGQLTAQLRSSRDRLAMAQEDERGRLRRDLHDGLGPTLAALTFKVDTARNLLTADPKAQTLLLDIRDGLRDTVADVRRLVDGLRPALLDQVGLGGALANLVENLPGPTRFRFVLAGHDAVDTAVGVAAYRIAQEAVTNVVRHARAATCDVELTTGDGSLVLVVRDDGGGTAAAGLGNGMVTMRERAEEAGGTLTVSSQPGQGTVVTVTLPKGSS
jgi:signal transduction histidine kinase